jgi:dTDP-4-dehydrorhamnose 3,5-epimerase
MSNVVVLETGIEGAVLTKPKVWGDSRGAFFEAFRASWFSERQRWQQWNVSRSSGCVVRGLHFHKLQTDYWHVVAGKITVGLVDLRAKSPTYRVAKTITLEAGDPAGLYIPPGVLHGYRIDGDATIMYLVDVEYTGKDEYGVLWNDPALKLPGDWYDGVEPTVSKRDAEAPLLDKLVERPD